MAGLVSTIARLAGALTEAGMDRVTEVVGGPARRRAVLLLAATLSLSSADSGTVGALAAQIESAFHVGNTQLGLLVTVSSLVGATAALPMGVLADRANRTRILAVSIGSWSLAMVATGLATSYLMMVLTRLVLGMVMAAAGPMVASLIGDLFPADERSRIYGFVLTGEILGAGAGLLLAGDLGAATSWRYAFFLLAVPSLVLAVLVWRLLPEPARGGQSWLLPGDEEIRGADDFGPDGSSDTDGAVPRPTPPDSDVRRRARQRDDVHVDRRLVLRRDPESLHPWDAGRYILRIPTVRVLIVSSALGYFFLAGLRTFGVMFAEAHFGLSQGLVSSLLVLVGVGGIAGTLVGGRVADRLIGRGVTDGRMLAGGMAFVAVAAVVLPAMVSSAVVVSLPLFIVGGALLGSANPPLDAARLDIVPSLLWGRAESVRTFVRTLLEAFAPLLFGFVSSLLGGGRAGGLAAGINSSHQHISAGQSTGLEYTFLIMLAPLAASGALLLHTRRRYLRDVATADVSDRPRSTAQREDHPAPEGCE